MTSEDLRDHLYRAILLLDAGLPLYDALMEMKPKETDE